MPNQLRQSIDISPYPRYTYFNATKVCRRMLKTLNPWKTKPQPAQGANRMLNRRPYRDAPDAVKKLFEELRASGSYLVYEDERHQPLIFVSSLLDAASSRRMTAAARLRKILAQTPDVPQTEEEVVQDINDTLTAIQEEARQGAVS